MKTSKFALLSFAIFTFATPALAATTRTIEARSDCYALVNNETAYRIYFDHDKPGKNDDLTNFFNTDEKCKGKYDELKNKIEADFKTHQNGVLYVVARTDNMGERPYNEALSKRRFGAISKLFINDEIFPKQNNTFSNIKIYYVGESDDNVQNGTNPTSKADWRAVDIIFAGKPIDKDPRELTNITIEYKPTITQVTNNITNNKEYDDTKIQIKTLSAYLSGYNFEKSHWKNDEGNFNTARLVSDSVAGVVLGTAGGLITSNVIKKNQIKHGMDDIRCTVGGQITAMYGDDFYVNMKQY